MFDWESVLSYYLPAYSALTKISAACDKILVVFHIAWFILMGICLWFQVKKFNSDNATQSICS